MDNAAFVDNPNELSRILKTLARRVESDVSVVDIGVMDPNGNKIGFMSIIND